MDMKQLRVRRKAELSTNHTSVESEGKQFASLIFPSCFHLKKEAAQKYSPPQPAKPGGPQILAKCAYIITHLHGVTPRSESKH